MRHGLSHVLVGVSVACALSCGSSGSGSGGGGGGGGGGDGGTGPIIDGRGCDITKLPTEDNCTVFETVGVFVSSSKGTIDGDGTRAKPLKTIGAALDKAAADGKRVYACAETFGEQVTVHNGVAVFGYFDCANWAVSSTLKARVDSPTSPALLATDIDKPTPWYGFEIVAPERAGTDGQSSIALFAKRAGGLQVISSTLHARNAAAGADGQRGATVVNVNPVLPTSGNAEVRCGATDTLCIAGAKPGVGGKADCRVGGTPMPALNGKSGGNGGGGSREQYKLSVVTQQYFYALLNASQAGLPQPGTADVAQGGPASGSRAGQLGQPVADGEPGKQGKEFGGIDDNGYLTSDGTRGGDAAGGQGGGGGGGADRTYSPVAPAPQPDEQFFGPSGGGGGAGGCGGVGGGAGQGGGASIALLAIDGAVSLRDTLLMTESGGAAGKGNYGSNGTSGEGGAVGGIAFLGSNPLGGQGGMGGPGGVGAPGGNGGGGPSIAIVWKGLQPKRENVAIQLGKGGAGQVVRADIPSSVSGLNVEEYAVP